MSYLKASGLLDRLVEDAPFRHTSPNFHSYFIGSIRISPGVDVRPGNRHSGGCGMPRLWEIVDGLRAGKKPRLIRGDAGYGGDENMREAKRRGRPRKNVPMSVQQEFDFVGDRVDRCWDCCALVTNDEKLDAATLARAYRDRGDCGNNFDEYRNQYGSGGFVTKDLKPCRAIARLIAIVANWWNVFCRLADGDRHLEPTTSRPMYNVRRRTARRQRSQAASVPDVHAPQGSRDTDISHADRPGGLLPEPLAAIG